MDVKDLLNSLQKENFFESSKEGFSDLKIKKVERKIPKRDEEKIKKEWDILSKQGVVSHSSPIVAIDPNRTIQKGKILFITTYPTDFMHYMTTLNDPFLRIWALGVSALTRLNYRGDMFYLFGERDSKTKNVGGKLENIPGGFMEPVHLESKDPARATLEQELREETGISPDKISSLKPIYLAQLRRDPRSNGRNYQDVCLEFLLDLSAISPDEVRHSFLKEKREHTKIHFVPEKRLPNFTFENFDRLTLRTRKTLHHHLSNGY